MIKGKLMPQEPKILASVLSVTFVGPGPLPKNWLHHIFTVRREYVGIALRWLKDNNPCYYGDIQIEETRLAALPEDDVPIEISATARQQTDYTAVQLESAGYAHQADETIVPEDLDEGLFSREGVSKQKTIC